MNAAGSVASGARISGSLATGSIKSEGFGASGRIVMSSTAEAMAALAADSIDGDPARDDDTLPAFLSDDEEAGDDEADEPAVIAAE